ncbi:hypothetical protein BGZ83_006667 [Gryganskiella cystojenkinii]|nr:hypothetical protein BGZ83_006667 [Gryganskiella cystojenkinii]
MGDNGVSSVLDVLEEWRFGFQGGPAIQDLNRELGLHWIGGDDGYAHYLVRQSIIQEYLRLVSFILRADIYQGVGTKDTFASEYAVRVLEERQGSNSIVSSSIEIGFGGTSEQ